MKRLIAFDSTLNTFRGPIVDWCRSLRNSIVDEIRLLPSSRPSSSAPLCVVVLLQDGSMYRLQRSVKWVKREIMPDIQLQDTIEKVLALDVGGTSNPLVTIKFKEHHYPNLLFLLRVCRSIQKHGTLFKAPHYIMDCSDKFFALALVLNVARSCLPQRSIIDASNSQPDYCILLEGLWQEIYQSLQRQGYAFWERTIAKRTKNLARELIYRLARDKVLQLFGEKGHSVEETSIAASTVARIEALVEKKELTDPTVWDEAWDTHWKQAWKQHGPVIQLRDLGGRQTLASLSGSASTIPTVVDGRSSGRVAGRTPVKLSPTKARGSLLNVILAGAHSQPSERFVNNAGESSTHGDGIQSLVGVSYSTTNGHMLKSEDVSPNLCRVSITKRYDHAVNWLGNSCLLSDSNTYKIWATPRESAIESAWGVAWPEGASYGRNAAKSIFVKPEKVDKTRIEANSAGTKSRMRTLSIKIVRFGSRVSQKFSLSLNRESGQNSPTVVVSNTADSAEAGHGTLPDQTPPATPIGLLRVGPPIAQNLRIATSNIISDIQTDSPAAMHSPSWPGANKHSPIITRLRKVSGASTSSKLRTPISPTTGLPRILEVSSHVDLPLQDPATGAAEASSQSPATARARVVPPENSDSNASSNDKANPRKRSESITKLRKHVMSRWSDPEPYKNFEIAFRDKTQERQYRENIRSSCELAAKGIQGLNPALLETKLREVGPMKQATEAWDRANSILSKVPLEQKLKALAQHEWERLADRYGNTSLVTSPGGDWENRFISAWEQVWKESWAAAWTAVWSQSFEEAISRGIEFGVDYFADNDSELKLGRKTYEQLKSSKPYEELKKSLLDNCSPLGSLEQIHQWIKEIGYLSESLQYSVPTFRDECMQILVLESKTKTPPTLMDRLRAVEAESEPIEMSHYKLQGWLADGYILKEVRGDKELHKLFLRGIEEVWESVLEMNRNDSE
ncbi:Tuberin [Rhizoctonia solani]|uniref:Tuberin n=1 Tax=Rhizoctonia solani TaxID=456999 RepID=A0A0K6G6J1_9AGAM|nr:Tuberin [Rhizoctonia solani]